MSTQTKTHLDLYEGLPEDRTAAINALISECTSNVRGRTRVRQLAMSLGMSGAQAVGLREQYQELAEYIMNQIGAGIRPADSPSTNPPQPPAQVPHEERLRLIQHVRQLEEHFGTEPKPETWWHTASIDALNQYKSVLEASAESNPEPSQPDEAVSEMELAPTPQPPSQQRVEPTVRMEVTPEPEPTVTYPAQMPAQLEVPGTLPPIPQNHRGGPDEWEPLIQDVESTRQMRPSPTGYVVPQHIIDRDPEGALKLWYFSFMDEDQIKKAASAKLLTKICGSRGLNLPGITSESKKGQCIKALMQHLWPNGHVEFYPKGLNNGSTPAASQPASQPAPQPASTQQPAYYPPVQEQLGVNTDPLAHTGRQEYIQEVVQSVLNPPPENSREMLTELWNRQELILNMLDQVINRLRVMDPVLAEMSRGIIRIEGLPHIPATCSEITEAAKWKRDIE